MNVIWTRYPITAREALESAGKEGHLAIAVDLAGVEYADSTMIGLLIGAFKTLTQNRGLICLFNVAPELHEFFRQTVLDRLIEICKDEQTALSCLRAVRSPNARV